MGLAPSLLAMDLAVVFYDDVVAIIGLVLKLAALGVEGWAFIHCATQRAEAFGAAGKLSKGAWLGITGAAVLVTLIFPPQGILGLVAVTAALVYHVDVRPALKEVTGGGPW